MTWLPAEINLRLHVIELFPTVIDGAQQATIRARDQLPALGCPVIAWIPLSAIAKAIFGGDA